MSRVLGIGVEPSRVTAAALSRGRVVWAAEASYDCAADLTEVLARLAADRPAGIRAARVALTGAAAQIKVVETMPRLGPGDLAAHVALQPRRYFLANGARLVTDAVPWGGSNGDGHRPALLAAAPEPLVEAIAAGLEAAGLQLAALAPAAAFPHRVLVAAPAGLAPLEDRASAYFAAFAAASGKPVVALLPAALEGARRRRAASGARRWATLCVLSLALAGLAHVGALVHRRGAADSELATLRPTVERALETRRDLDRTTDALEVLERAARQRSTVAALLADLTRALPDSAFLAVFRLESDGRGTLVGYAPRSGPVLAALARVPRVRAPDLDGPVTREMVGAKERERFTIRFRLAPGSR